MEFLKISTENFEDLKKLQIAYKNEIGEDSPTSDDLTSLYQAIKEDQISFYGCVCDSHLVGCCSICTTFSTFNYKKSGVFEDFFIEPEYRHRGIAKKLVKFAFTSSGVGSLSVGCADCDLEMYKALGFSISLGNLLAFES